jgi:hypothetical protein
METKQILLWALVALVVYVLFFRTPTSYYKFSEDDFSKGSGARTGGPRAASFTSMADFAGGEYSGQEKLGEFSPDKILQGQNFLDPRSQIGYPETIGGNLRNANRQERSEPPNPRDPVSIFNLSTIPPDTMRPKFEIQNEYKGY